MDDHSRGGSNRHADDVHMHRGKQYVVFATGGQQHAAEFVAFALP